MRTKKILIVLLLSVGSIFGFNSHTEAESTSGRLETVDAVVLPYLSFGPLFIAVEEGFFKEQNIQIKFVELQKGVQAIPQLLQGNIDVSAGFLDAALINGIAKGGDAKIVASKSFLDEESCSYIGMLQNPEAPVTDWSGVRVATRFKSFLGYYVDQFLLDKGVTLEDAVEVNMPTPARLAALQNKSVDVVPIGEPWIQRMIDAGGTELIHEAKAILPNVTTAFVFFSGSFIKERPEISQKFIIAYLQGVRQYNQGKTKRNVEILTKYTKLDTDLLNKVCWPAMEKDGRINMHGVTEFQKWFVKQGLIDSELSIDQIWDDRFIEEAVKVLSDK